MSTGQENKGGQESMEPEAHHVDPSIMDEPLAAHVDPSIREGLTLPGGTNAGMSPAGAHVDPSNSPNTAIDTGSTP